VAPNLVMNFSGWLNLYAAVTYTCLHFLGSSISSN